VFAIINDRIKECLQERQKDVFYIKVHKSVSYVKSLFDTLFCLLVCVYFSLLSLGVCIHVIDGSDLCGDHKLLMEDITGDLRFFLNLYSQQQWLRSICSSEGGKFFTMV
jgi:hypothetical protein